MTSATDDEDAHVLGRADMATQTVAYPVGVVLSAGTQAALERLILRDRLRLVDVKPSERGTVHGLTRVFIVTDAGRQWLAKHTGKPFRTAAK